MKDRLLVFFRTYVSIAAVIAVACGFTLAGCGGTSSAQDTSGGGAAQSGSPASGRHRMAEALASLGLSDDQKSQIRAIMSDMRKSNANADPETKRANYKAAFAKIDTILTPDQRTKLHAKLDEFRKERQQQSATPQS